MTMDFGGGRYMAELSDQAHKERRQREKALTGLIIEDPTLTTYEIIIELQNWGLDYDDYDDYVECYSGYKAVKCCTGQCVFYENIN